MRAFKNFVKGVRLRDNNVGPNAIGDLSGTLTTADNGAIYHYQDRLKAFLAGTEYEIITNEQTQTLENKTIDGTAATGNNTVLNDAGDVSYDDANEPVRSFGNDVQAALDAVKVQLEAQDEANEIAYDNTTSGLTATDVQAAIDEVESRVQGSETDVADLITLSGVAANSTDLGTFTGATIPDASDNKEALQALETAHEEVDQNVNDLITLSGVAENATDLGTFTGSIIPDASDNKEALQALETAQETHAADTSTHGVAGDIVGTTDTQILTNKTLTSPKINEITTTTNADLSLNPNGTGRVVSSKHHSFGTTRNIAYAGDNAPTGANATISLPTTGGIRLTNGSLTSVDMIGAGLDGQELTLENATGNTIVINDETGGTAANRIKTGQKAAINFADEASIDLKYDGTEARWMVIGGTGGSSSAGGVSTWIAEKFDVNQASTLQSGNNATFLGGGALAGTLANETSAPLSGTRSIKFTLAAGSLNDYVTLNSRTVQPEAQGKNNVFKALFSYDGADNDIQMVVFDDTNNVVLGTNNVKAGTARLHSIVCTVPDTCLSLTIGFRVLVANNTKIVLFDNVEADYDGIGNASYIATTEWSDYTPTTQGLGTPTITTARYKREGSDALIYVRITPGTTTAVEAQIGLPSGLVVKTGSGSDVMVGIGKQQSGSASTDLPILITAGDAFVNIANGTVAGAAQLTPATGSAALVSSQPFSFFVRIPIEGWVNTSDYFISNATLGSNATSYTPTITGFGTPTNVSFFYSRINDKVLIQGSFTSGIATAVEAQIGLPPNLTVASGQTSVKTCGQFITGDSNAAVLNCLMTTGDSFINVGRQLSGSGTGLTPQNANALASNGTNLSFTCIVPITQWNLENSVTILSPIIRTTIFADIKAAGTDGGTFTAGADQTRVLNTQYGDLDFASLSSNQFTLQPGKYKIWFSSPGQRVNGHIAWIRQITATAADILPYGTTAYSVSSDTVSSSSTGFVVVEISVPTTYELRARCATTRSNDGFGWASNVTKPETYGMVVVDKYK